MNALFEFNAEAMEPTEIPFGEWLPDLPALNNPGALEALNVIPSAGGSYAPFNIHEPVGDVLPEAVRGAGSVIQANDVVQLFAGTVNAAYTRIGDTDWTGLVTGAFSENYAWQFIRVGEQMVVMHQDFVPWRNEIGTLGPLTIIGGSPPRAACGAHVGDFLMLGNLLADPDDGGNPFPSRIRWGGFNNIDSPWVTDPATQADFQDMPAEGGSVISISGREYATIFQERMISRAAYRGPPTIFDIVTVEDKRGCLARDAVVDVGAFKFFIAEDGFFVWNGTNSSPIGDSRVNNYFFKRLQYSRRSRICGAHDPVNGCVHWAFPTASLGVCNEIITYSYRENRFSHTEIDLEYLFNSAPSTITAEELTEPYESYTVSFDSELFRTGGRQQLAAYDPNHAYGMFTGAPMEAVLETGEYNAPGNRRIFVNDARPLIDVTAPVVLMRTVNRDQLIGEPIQYSEVVSQEIDGRCPIISDARYMRFRVEIPDNVAWSKATGVELFRRTGGSF